MNHPSHRGRVAIVGAGLAGLEAAAELQRRGFEVRLFDKGRGPAGRISTRRTPELAVDHGAQYFTARSELFRGEVEEWVRAGCAAVWEPRWATQRTARQPDPAETRYVGAPRMSSIARHLARDAQVACGVRIDALKRDGAQWRLIDTHGIDHGSFPLVVLTVPAPQAVPLLEHSPALRERAQAAHYDPCWASWVRLEEPLDLPFDAGCPADERLAWCARNDSKPGRPEGELWLLHASPAFSHAHEAGPIQQPELVRRALTEAFLAWVERPDARVSAYGAHYWRYARCAAPESSEPLWEPELGLGVCGDWCAGPRVEDAWTSGRRLAERIALQASAS